MFPQLETSRLLLTELVHTDASGLFDVFSNERVVEFYDMPAFTPIAEAERLIQRMRDRYESKVGIRWAIRLKSSNALIGTCGFNSRTPAMRNAVVGYDLGESFWGKGLATEALVEIIRAGFEGTLACGELHRIQAELGRAEAETEMRNRSFEEENAEVREESDDDGAEGDREVSSD